MRISKGILSRCTANVLALESREGDKAVEQANAKRQEAIDNGCEAPDDPLQEVTSPHRWRRQDIIDMHDFLEVLCDDDSFTEVPDYWPAQSIEEIEADRRTVATPPRQPRRKSWQKQPSKEYS